MGTDIHMACEVRRNGKWELLTNKIFINPWFNPDPTYSWEENLYTNIPYERRCYNLFAILADVRNGTGFAGCKTGDKFNPISLPKGYPDDMCDLLKGDINYYDYDERAGILSNEHSASWLTLRELLNYDWNQMHRNYGCVSEEQYRDFIMNGKDPESWSGDVWGRDIIHIDHHDMVALIQNNYQRDNDKKYYTYCYFNPTTYKEAAGSFYEDVIPALQSLVTDEISTEDIRLVFDFDS